MISATPNSVRWDQVNRVTYRFQALNFQSDVLEALVLNSPPLSRRSRRKPIIRGMKSDCSGNKVEFLRARSLERRSLSFDEGIADNQKSELKFYEKSRVSHDRYGSGREDQGPVVFEPRRRPVFGAVENTIDANKAKVVENDHNIDNISCLSVDCSQTDTDIDELSNKSKESLIQLIKDLRYEIRELKRDGDKRNPGSETRPDQKQAVSQTSEVCCHCHLSQDSRNQPESLVIKDQVLFSKDLLFPHMQQLELEVHRTRKIANMFEDEISSLKDRFSSVLTRTKNLEKIKSPPANSTFSEKTEKIKELCNGLSSGTEEVASQNVTKNLCDEGTVGLVNLDPVSVLG